MSEHIIATVSLENLEGVLRGEQEGGKEEGEKYKSLGILETPAQSLGRLLVFVALYSSSHLAAQICVPLSSP